MIELNHIRYAYKFKWIYMDNRKLTSLNTFYQIINIEIMKNMGISNTLIENNLIS